MSRRPPEPVAGPDGRPALDRRVLEDALTELAVEARPRPDCPPAAALWEAVRGEGEAEQRRRVIDHMATCETCSEAWRLAVELVPEPAAAAPEPIPVTPAPWLGWRPLAAAAALLAAVGVAWLARSPAVPPAERGGHPEIAALTGERISRSAARLAWTPGPAGTIYEVWVTDGELERVTEATGLEEPELLLAPEVLAPLETGERLLWRVEALLPDGRRRASPTFVTRVE